MAVWAIYQGKPNDKKYHVEIWCSIKAQNKKEVREFILNKFGKDFGGGYSININKYEEIKNEKNI